MKKLLCKLFNLEPKENLWNLEKTINHQFIKVNHLTSANFHLKLETASLEKENKHLRQQAEEAIKDMAQLTGEVLSLKNQLSYAKSELMMMKHE